MTPADFCVHARGALRRGNPGRARALYWQAVAAGIAWGGDATDKAALLHLQALLLAAEARPPVAFSTSAAVPGDGEAASRRNPENED